MEDKKNDLVNQTQGIRTFEMVVNVSGFLPGTIDDWPANVQDEIFAAAERKSDEVQLPLKIVHSVCDKDVDTGIFYIHVTLSEIVVADERMMKPKTVH